MKALPLSAHSLVRGLLSGPCGVLVLIGLVRLHLAVVPKPDVPAQHPWHPLSLIALLPIGFALGYFGIRWLIGLIPARCTRCGGTCYPAPWTKGRLYDCAGCKDRISVPFRVSDMLGGVVFIMGGLAVMFITVLFPNATTNGPRWIVIPFGLVFVVVGLFALGIWGPIERWLNRRFPATARMDWHSLMGTTIACASGQGESAFPSGRGAVVVSGLVFFLAGVAIGLPLLNNGRTDTIAQAVVGTLLLFSFALLPLLMMLQNGFRKLGLEGSGALLASLATTGALAALGVRTVVVKIRKRREAQADLPPASPTQ
jgi:hypothetical protein